MTTKTDSHEGINKAVHEALGKCWHEPLEVKHNDCWPRYDCAACGKADLSGYMSHRPDEVVNLKSFIFVPTERPNYCSDLNAVREFELFVIEKVGKGSYGITLRNLLYSGLLNANSHEVYEAGVIANAEARCRAGLAALGVKI